MLFGLAADAKKLTFKAMHPLTQKLTILRRRLILHQRAEAACWTAAAVLAVAIGLGFVDYFVRFADPGLRIIATVALVSAAMWAIYRWWYVPSLQKLAPLAVARRIEAKFPQLRDMLASSMEFLDQSEDDRTAGSPQLRRLVVAEAAAEVERLPLDDVIDRRPLRRAARWLAAPLMLLLICLAWNANAVGTAFLRLVAPLGSTQWPRTNHLAFRDVPKHIAVGQTFEVELIDTAGGALPDDVRIEYRLIDRNRRESTSEPMTHAGNVMLARRENVRQPFAFRAVGGDDHTMPWQWVEVVEPPQLAQISITAHPPAYMGLPAVSAEGHLEVLAGSGLEVRGLASEPLSAARILMEGSPPIIATIGTNGESNDRRAIQIRSDQWIAGDSGPYRLELSDSDGVAGIAGQWNLRVQPDPPPNVSWRRPSEDVYATAIARVPIEVTVADNLAAERVELVYIRRSRTDGAETTSTSNDPTEDKIEIYRGPQRAALNIADDGTVEAETRSLEYRWELALLQLPVGTELVCHVAASDYRPGTGRTAAPRRITIISHEDLIARLADHQAQIVRQLERALAAQRTTRDDVRRLETRLQNVLAVSDGQRAALQAAEINQRQVRALLLNPKASALASVHRLLEEIEINQVPASDAQDAMNRLIDELDRLSRGSLSVAETQLVAGRKTAMGSGNVPGQANPESAPPFVPTAQPVPTLLVAAGAAQDEVIASLERLIKELSGSTDVRRLAQQLTELRRDQLTHRELVREEIGLETLPLQIDELSRGQRAKLESAAASQSAIATRFENVLQALEQVGRKQVAQDSTAVDAAARALDLARGLAIATSMQETSRDLKGNRVGNALARESQIAADLQQVVEALSGNNAERPDQLVDQPRQAEGRLAKLREQLAALRQRIAQEERRADAASSAQLLRQLAGSQHELQRETQQLADQLDRMQAQDASQSTHKAANRLANPSKNTSAENASQPRLAPSSEVERAEKDLEQAAQQLANQRQELENDLTLELVRRFQAELATMVERQKSVIKETIQLEAARSGNAALDESKGQSISKLALEEQELAQLAGEHAESLAGLGAVRMGLEESQHRLVSAASLLDSGDTGRRTQQAEQHALARLEGMLQAFAQTASESAPNRNAPQGNDGNPSGEQPQRRPTFELLEVKMLRMLQVDLNERTRAVEDQIAGMNGPQQDRRRRELAREAQVLQAEQRRLAELVQEMLLRDNEGGK